MRVVRRKKERGDGSAWRKKKREGGMNGEWL